MINFVPTPVFTAIDEDGNPLIGAKLYTFATGTTTPKVTYVNAAKSAQNTNPIILDSNGQAHVWLDSGDGAYRFRLDDSDDVTLWTSDGIQAPGGEVSALMTVTGDLVYASAANTPAKLARGTAYQNLRMNATGTAPEWANSPASLVTARGDLIRGTAANVIARLAKGTALQTLQMDSIAVDPEWAASPQSVLTAQGDILYASAANTLAKLAIGSAGHLLRVNAAGTAPSWGPGFKLGQFDRDTATATGTQAVTGVGFKPSMVIFLAACTGIIPQGAEMSIGIDSGSAAYCLNNYHNVVNYTWNFNYIYSIFLQQGVGIEYAGNVDSFDSDGFTLSWIKTGAKVSTVHVAYLAIH